MLGGLSSLSLIKKPIILRNLQPTNQSEAARSPRALADIDDILGVYVRGVMLGGISRGQHNPPRLWDLSNLVLVRHSEKVHDPKV